MKHVITFLCLVAATALYAAGSATGAVVFFFAGVLAEGIFWMRLFRRKESA